MADEILWSVDRTKAQNEQMQGEIDGLRQLYDDRKAEFEQRAAVIVQDIQAVERIVSTPVPVGIVSEDYAAAADEQRIAFLSAENGVITLAPAIEYYSRRSVVTVVGEGSVILSGTFLDDTRDGTGTLTDPIIKRGQVFEFLGLFIPDPNGNADAPEALTENGEVMSDNVKGFYRLQVVSFHGNGVAWDEYQADKTNLQNAIATAQATANSANNRAMIPGAKGDKGDKGDIGNTGATGLQGAKGDTGSQGAKGDTGAIGATGAVGATGPAGTNGTNGTNATTTAVATQSANGLMSSTSQTKLDGLSPTLGTGTTPVTVALPAILLGGAYSFTVTVTGARTYMTATVNPAANGTFLTNLSNWRAVVTANDVVTVYLNAGLAIGAGNQQFAIKVIQ